MDRQKYSVTFERVTDESVEHGDAESRGYVAQGLSLRAALHTIEGEIPSDSEISAIEPSDSDIGSTRWFTWYGSRGYHSGVFHNYSLHLPESATPSTKRRIARLVGIRR